MTTNADPNFNTMKAETMTTNADPDTALYQTVDAARRKLAELALNWLVFDRTTEEWEGIPSRADHAADALDDAAAELTYAVNAWLSVEDDE